MRAEASIVKQYEYADFEKRVDIMLENFANFTARIDICYEAIKYRIKEDRAFARRQDKGDIMIWKKSVQRQKSVSLNSSPVFRRITCAIHSVQDSVRTRPISR